MKEQFLKTVFSAFNNVIYTRFGSVAVVQALNSEQTLMRLTAFDAPSHVINEMKGEERMKYIVVDLYYKFDEVDFESTYSKSKKISEIVTNIEVLVYTAEEGVVITNENPAK